MRRAADGHPQIPGAMCARLVVLGFRALRARTRSWGPKYGRLGSQDLVTATDAAAKLAEQAASKDDVETRRA